MTNCVLLLLTGFKTFCKVFFWKWKGKCEICWELSTAPIMRACKAVTQTEEPLQTWEWILKLPIPTNSLKARSFENFTQMKMFAKVSAGYFNIWELFVNCCLPGVFLHQSSKESMIEFSARILLQQHWFQTSLYIALMIPPLIICLWSFISSKSLLITNV